MRAYGERWLARGLPGRRVAGSGARLRGRRGRLASALTRARATAPSRSGAAAANATLCNQSCSSEALTVFVEDASARCRRELARGAEVPFELASQRARSAPCRRSTATAADEAPSSPSAGALTLLPSHARGSERAARTLQGLDRYLASRARGVGSQRPARSARGARQALQSAAARGCLRRAERLRAARRSG